MRFPGFSEAYHYKPLSNYLWENTDRNKNLQFTKDDVLSVSGEFGVVNQIAFQGRSFAGASVADYHVVETDDIVYTKSPLKANPYGVIKANNGVPGIVSTLYAVYHPKETTSPQYVDYYFSNDLRLNKYLKPLVNIGAKHDMKINNEFALTGNVAFPGVCEQREIAEFLSKLDSRIAKQRDYIEALKKYKRGLLSAIFERRIRFKADDGSEFPEWREVRLSQIFKKVSRKNRGNVIKNVITNSAEYGLVPQRSFFDKDIAVDGNTEGYFIIKPGDFVYNPRKSNTAPYGPFNRYTLPEEGIISPLYTCLKLFANVDAEYLAWYFKGSSWYRYVYSNGSQGVRHDRVSMTDEILMGIPVSLPCYNEQQKISAYLSSFEKMYAVEQQKLENIQSIKQGLLQQLFI